MPVSRCFLQLTPTQRFMPHWKSAWGPTSLFLRASCLRGRYFEHVLINLPTIGRHSHPPVPLDEFGHNKATNLARHPESHLRRQAFSRNGKLSNAVNHARQRRRQYKCGEDSKKGPVLVQPHSLLSDASINELDRVLATESFQIEEWLSSSNAVQQSLNSYQRNLIMKFHLAKPVSMDGEKRVKTISVAWNLQPDVLSFAVKETMTGEFTRRAIFPTYATP